MTMMMNNNNNVSSNGQQNLGDTTLTKVFVGGLAWETPKEAMREHFEKYGEILEAVIISDKVTGRSKGYGFVTFKDAEAAKKACEDATPVINGRRANCNLASLGAKRARPSSNMPPPPPQLQVKKYEGGNVVGVGPRGGNTAAAAPANHLPWYYPGGAPPPAAAVPAAAPFHHHHQAVPIYGYSPTYIATDMSYSHKLSYTGGSYMNGHFSQVYPGQPMVGTNALMPMYPLYHFHQTQTMGLPAHMYSPSTPPPMASAPALISKPTSISPSTVCLAVE
ncbi:probable RNA-binding protein ARP1 isoform X3 [Coffea arabica]|uniref:Probable RNA-binding protein ARP1 isoform X3 n=1 Tax=Coffea arabica TaxID=13443 RepID=A0A6P6U7W9_COFAR|nr:probable RNA-binding protein ARP1 isoform X3 [Coffea arabica]